MDVVRLGVYPPFRLLLFLLLRLFLLLLLLLLLILIVLGIMFPLTPPSIIIIMIDKIYYVIY